MTWDGTVAIVTGGGQGIGKATARRLLEAGAAVVLAEIDEEAGRETEAELAALGQVLFVPCDVGDPDRIEAAVGATVAWRRRLDFLVNNCGIGAGGPLEELRLDAWHRVLGVNLLSDRAGFITGQNFVVDGGMTRKMIYV